MIILGTNSIKDTGYNVDNSLRFDDAGSDYLRTSGFGTPTSSKKMTISFWTKRANLGINTRTISATTSGNSRDGLMFNTSDKILFFLNNAPAGNLVTTRVFRDTSAWYHFVIAIDTTQGTASNRVKIYVNGVQETSFDSGGDGIVYPDENYDILGFGQNKEQTIGADNSGGGSNEIYAGYMAEFCFIDGLQLAPTSFGEFGEDSGIWKPIDVSGLTFGNNGYYLDFENSGALGADVSGNTNNFSVNNLTATDQSTDTCTNNFATLNPLHSIGAGTELSQGNLEYDPSGHHRIISTIAPSSGKWYAEVKGIDNPDKFNAGVCYYPIPANGSISSFAFGQGVNGDVGRWSNDFGIKANGDYGHNNSWSSYMASLEGENNNIVGIYMDLDNYKLYFSKNGSLVSSTGKDLTNNGYPYGFISVGEAATFQWNFGNPSFAISSGNTDGEYGNFEYSTTITGDGASKTFKALCTKNLAEYG